MIHLDPADQMSWAAEHIVAHDVDPESLTERELLDIHRTDCLTCRQL